MKTVKPVGKDGGVPVRLKDGEAAARVKSGQWVYCEKLEWKEAVRDAPKKEAEAKAKAEQEAKIKAKQERKKENEKKIVGKK